MTDKNKLQTLINQFSDSDLRTNALALFNELGYQSSRTFNKPVDEILPIFDREKALCSEWINAPFLFQLAEDNLSNIQSLLTDVDGTIIESYMFVAIELEKLEYSRTQLVTITRELNKSPQPVLILFKHGDTLTLSVIHRRLHKRDESKDVLEKVTLLKDIRISEPHRAHVDILADLAFDNLGLKAGASFVDLHNAWQTVLDTKTLNKQFYKELSQWYFWARKEENVYFPNAKEIEADKTSVFNNDDKSRKHDAESLIRLLTRLLFVWFIKEKNLIPEQLFDENWIKSQLGGFKPIINDNPNATFQGNDSHYYRAILQNLFFATLNQICEKRGFIKNEIEHKDVTNLMRYKSYFKEPESFLILMKEVVPFMNGGLFDCLDKVIPNLKNKQGGNVVAYEDSFLDRPDNQLKVPDYIFFGTHKNIDLSAELGSKQKSVEIRGLIDILKSYKFTIAENTPIEEDIALDPELLGQVFENLLASYNPEIKTTARKQTGSFYTPREIVDYMVDESLTAYFSSINSEFKVEKLRDLLSYNTSGNPFNEQQTKQLINAIDNCKILDPACGSGAFPMGILHKLVHCLHKLDDNNRLWKARQIEKINYIDDADFRDKTLQALENVFDNEVDYGRKLYLIENCIYGVDIQAIAIQISKLRFFISLIVDQTIRNTENFGILPLPNLETKFVAANTLVGIDKPKTGINANSTINIFDNPEIEALEHKLKNVRHRLFSAKTPATKRKLREEDNALRKQISELLEQQGWKNETAQQLAHWNPYDQNANANFFDVEWMFGLGNGFDIVIGNPPYVLSRETFSDKDKLYYKQNYKLTHEKPNLYLLFLEKSNYLMNSKGTLAFIIPNSWLGIDSAYKLRKYILENSSILKIINLLGQTFENAGVEPSVFIYSKNKTESKVQFTTTVDIEIFDAKFSEISQEEWLDNRNYLIDITSNTSENTLLKKIMSRSVPLSSLYEVKVGLQAYETGKGTPKQTSDDVKNHVFDYDYKYDENTFQYLGGSDVMRYAINWSGLWLRYGKWLSQPKTFNQFSEPRILIREITSKFPTVLHGTYTEKVFLNNKSILNIIQLDKKFNLKFLLAYLNSKLISFYHLRKTVKGNRLLFPKIVIKDLKEYPIPKISEDQQKPFIQLVDYILFIKKQPFYNTTDLYFAEERLMSNFFENLIDALVYELYFPKELQEAKKQFMSLVVQENLPELDAIEGDKVGALKQIVRRLTDKNHPLYNNLFFLDSVPVVRIIEGKA